MADLKTFQLKLKLKQNCENIKHAIISIDIYTLLVLVPIYAYNI